LGDGLPLGEGLGSIPRAANQTKTLPVASMSVGSVHVDRFADSYAKIQLFCSPSVVVREIGHGYRPFE
jgi:hypothetical protein